MSSGDDQQLTALLPAAAATKPQQPTPQRLPQPLTATLLVSPRQKGNPLLTHLRGVTWEYGAATLACDYLCGNTAILFLSLKYHKLHPSYIHTRLSNLGTSYRLSVLLLLIDTSSHSDALRELARTTATLVVAWSAQEAAGYVMGFKQLEFSGGEAIRGRRDESYRARWEECCTAVRGVNKTDAGSLMSNFGSVRAAIAAREEEVALLPGWGRVKTERWGRAVREPFKVGAGAARRRREAVEEAPPVSTLPQVAERLGIGKVREVVPGVEEEEEDEDAMAVVAEMEEAERRRRKTPAPPEGVMGALERLRQQDG